MDEASRARRGCKGRTGRNGKMRDSRVGEEQGTGPQPRRAPAIPSGGAIILFLALPEGAIASVAPLPGRMQRLSSSVEHLAPRLKNHGVRGAGQPPAFRQVQHSRCLGERIQQAPELPQR
eukprot:scaffold12543_cov115-Isochrysis_galbana.AAC.6